jgi:hypothetical protein
LWIYVPEGDKASQVNAAFGGSHPIPVRYLQQGKSLSITFQGQEEPVEWKVVFQSKRQ